MKKIIAYIAMSLDGYVADKNGSVHWLSGDFSDEKNQGSYPDFVKTIDTVILGHNTYKQIVNELSVDVWPYEKMETYVLTNKNYKDKKDIKFTNTNLKSLIESLKEKEGKNIWICGGASIINQLISLNLIDEYIISIIPTLLGGGIKLFDNSCEEHKLKLIQTRNYNGIVDLVYENR